MVNVLMSDVWKQVMRLKIERLRKDQKTILTDREDENNGKFLFLAKLQKCPSNTTLLKNNLRMERV